MCESFVFSDYELWASLDEACHSSGVSFIVSLETGSRMLNEWPFSLWKEGTTESLNSFGGKLLGLKGKLSNLNYHSCKVQVQYIVLWIQTNHSVNFLIHKYLPVSLIRFSGRF